MKIKTKSYFSQALMALLSLLFLITSVNLLQNIGRGTTDLSENSIAQAPTNTTYWIDDTTQTALGVDFDRYTLRRDTSASTTTYLIKSEKDLAFLSWTIYNNKAYNNHVSSSSQFFYSGITFKQTKDLDLSAYYWQPIGRSSSRCFSGNYDGDGHTVSGVYTPYGRGSSFSDKGLFGVVQGQSSTNKATIQNIGVINSFIQGEDNIGGVVGIATYSTIITNCYNTGTVSGSNQVGGVAGDASNSTITNCYNTGTVSGSNQVGGVAGDASNSTITNCYNTGTVSGNGSVGGIMGANNNINGGAITNCYNTGSVSAIGSIGGIAGSAYAITITNCYNNGTVEGTGNSVGGVMGQAAGGGYTITITNCYNASSVSGSSQVGGVMGQAVSGSTIINCFNAGSVSGDSVVGGVAGEASGATITNTYYGGDCEASIGGIYGADVDGQAEYLADLEVLAKNEEWYLDSSNWNSSYSWDFDFLWLIDALQNNGYPILVDRKIYWTDEAAQEALDVDFDNYTLSGSGTEARPYLIRSETDLAYLSWTIYTGNTAVLVPPRSDANCCYVGKYFKQTKNLDLSAYLWQPIGISATRDGVSVNRYFSGSYDGGGFSISGMKIDVSNQTGGQAGLFGYLYIYYSKVSSGNVTSQMTFKNLTIKDSSINGGTSVGTLAGYVYCYWAMGQDYLIVDNIVVEESVKFTNQTYVSGIVGEVDIKQGYYNSTFKNCVNYASISANNTSAQLTGIASGSIGLIDNCKNYGNFSGVFGSACGIASGAVAITNCTNYGSFEGNGSVSCIGSTSSGRNLVAPKIVNCINDESVTVNVTGRVEGIGSATKGSRETGDVYGVVDCFNYGDLTGETVYGIATTPTILYGDNIDLVKNCENYGNLNGKNVYGIGGSEAQNCKNHVSLKAEGGSASGIGASKAVDCVNYGDISGGDYVSGIVAQKTSSTGVVASNCQNYGNISGNNYVAGIVAYCDYYSYNSQNTLSNCINEGDITATGNYVGGIAGWVNSFDILQCENSGDITANGDYVGGVVGYFSNSASLISNSNTGTMTTEGSYIGGLVGSFGGSLVQDSVNYSAVQGASFIGGLIGQVNIQSSSSTSSMSISNYQNLSEVSATGNNVGSIIGGIEITKSGSFALEISNIFNSFPVSSAGDNVGGMIGYVSSTGTVSYNISSLSNFGYVSGKDNVGGLIGYTTGDDKAQFTITESLNLGAVSASGNYAGGLIGSGASVSISNSGSEGIIFANQFAGALFGQIGEGGIITDCYCIAQISQASLCGSTLENWTINNSLATMYVGDSVIKQFYGTDFSGFVWLNEDGSPLPKNFTIFADIATGTVTTDLLLGSGWTEWVA